MAYKSSVFDVMHVEGIIVGSMNSPEGAQILLENIPHWLSRRYFASDLLSNTAGEAGSNFPAPAIAGTVQQVIRGEVRSQRVKILSDILRTDYPTISSKILHTQGS